MALVGCKGHKERKDSKRMATFSLFSTHYGSIPRIAVGKLNAIRCLRSIDILVHYHMFMTDTALAEVEDDDHEAIVLTAKEISDFEPV